MQPIHPDQVRYIKLGPANAWFTACRAQNRIEFGYRDIPHELAECRDWRGVEARFLQTGVSPRKVRDFTR